VQTVNNRLSTTKKQQATNNRLRKTANPQRWTTCHINPKRGSFVDYIYNIAALQKNQLNENGKQ